MIEAVRTILSIVALSGGVLFFVAGTVGLLRFPDIFSRLHAVTKADTVGLGLVALGLILRTDSWRDGAVMLLIWLVAMASGAVTCQLYARFERERGRGREQKAGREETTL